MVKALKIEIFLLCMIILIGLAARSRRSLFSSTQQLLFSMLGYTSAAYMQDKSETKGKADVEPSAVEVMAGMIHRF